MDQEDHGGEMLCPQGRGDHVQYGGEREQAIPTKLAPHQAAKPVRTVSAPSSGRCPQCGNAVHERTINSVTMLACAPCQGIWLNKDQIPIFSQPGGGAWLETFLRGLGWWRPFHCD